jgi:hypothetical protein
MYYKDSCQKSVITEINTYRRAHDSMIRIARIGTFILEIQIKDNHIFTDQISQIELCLRNGLVDMMDSHVANSVYQHMVAGNVPRLRRIQFKR